MCNSISRVCEIIYAARIKFVSSAKGCFSPASGELLTCRINQDFHFGKCYENCSSEASQQIPSQIPAINCPLHARAEYPLTLFISKFVTSWLSSKLKDKLKITWEGV